MTPLPDQFEGIVRGDRFCRTCGANMNGATIVREDHYRMLVTHCPQCGQMTQVQETRRLTRAGQRWAGLVAALWIFALLGSLVGTNMAMIGLTAVILDEADNPMTKHIEEVYIEANPGDAGGIFNTSVQIVTGPGPVVPTPPTIPATSTTTNANPTAPTPATPAGTTTTTTTITLPPSASLPGGGSIQVIPAGPGRTLVIQQQDDTLRNRFRLWWRTQDSKSILAGAGGYADAIPWAYLWPFLFMGFIPLAFGFIWAMLLLNVNRRRMALAFIAVCVWFMLALLGMGITFPYFDESSSHVALALIAPPLLLLIGVYFCGLLLAGMLAGRMLARGIVRLTLPPKACSAMAQLWLVDGRRLPRVHPVA